MTLKFSIFWRFESISKIWLEIESSFESSTKIEIDFSSRFQKLKSKIESSSKSEIETRLDDQSRYFVWKIEQKIVKSTNLEFFFQITNKTIDLWIWIFVSLTNIFDYFDHVIKIYFCEWNFFSSNTFELFRRNKNRKNIQHVIRKKLRNWQHNKISLTTIRKNHNYSIFNSIKKIRIEIRWMKIYRQIN